MTLVAEPHTPTDHCDPPTLNGAGRTTDTFGASVEHAFGADVLVDNRVNPHLRLVSGHERVLHPKPSGKPDPTAHLTAEQVETLGRELDALRQQVIDSRGASDAAYIRRVIAFNLSLIHISEPTRPH